MSEREIVCVSCPVGCQIKVRIKDGQLERLEGNRCPRGEEYARQEALEPRRVLPTSVKVVGGRAPLVSVRTDRPVPKERLEELMQEIKGMSVEAPVRIGQIIAPDLLGTGVDLVATRSVPREDGTGAP